MKGFEKCSQVEKQAIMALLPFINKFGVQVVTTQNQIWLQKLYGDFFIKRNAGNVVSVELKAESENKTGNLFLESWSNRKWLNPGWMFTCRADRLWYYFVENVELYCCDFQKLRQWMLHDGNAEKYREKPQRKTKQLNDTWGWCVPIRDLRNASLDWEEFSGEEIANA